MRFIIVMLVISMVAAAESDWKQRLPYSPTSFDDLYTIVIREVDPEVLRSLASDFRDGQRDDRAIANAALLRQYLESRFNLRGVSIFIASKAKEPVADVYYSMSQSLVVAIMLKQRGERIIIGSVGIDEGDPFKTEVHVPSPISLDGK